MYYTNYYRMLQHIIFIINITLIFFPKIFLRDSLNKIHSSFLCRLEQLVIIRIEFTLENEKNEAFTSCFLISK